MRAHIVLTHFPYKKRGLIGASRSCRTIYSLQAPSFLKVLQQFVSLFQFRHSTCCDKLLILVGILSSIVAGCGLPAMVILFGDMLNAFVGNEQSESGYSEVVREQLGPGCFGVNQT